jgi:hypothetical protein
MNNTQATVSAIALGAILGVAMTSENELIKVGAGLTSCTGGVMVTRKMCKDEYEPLIQELEERLNGPNQ